MSVPSRRLVLAASAVVAFAGRAEAQVPDGPVKVMERYAAALQSRDVEALVALYTANGVFTRPDFPSAAGHDALRAAYKEVFATLQVSLRFDIREVEALGDIAWLRSNSSGKVKVLKTGVETSDSYHQLVVFRREAGSWKIRDYLYAPAHPSTPANS
jgi:uncharacterized protein (TIGR02246 family)